MSSEIGSQGDQEEIHDHLACLVTDAYNDTVDLYKEFCKRHSYWSKLCLHPHEFENEGYPTENKYAWKQLKKRRNGPPVEKNLHLKVDDYIDNVFQFFVKQFENDEVFPPNDMTPFPDDFQMYAKELNTLLFRVLAIMFSNEHESVHILAPDLKGLLHQVLYYSWAWDLLDESETECIRFITRPIREQYERDYKEEMEDMEEATDCGESNL